MTRLTHGSLPGTTDSAPRWIKSSLSFANSNCVEVADLPDGTIGVRDSKNPQGPVLRFSTGEWHAFVQCARNGEPDSLT